MSDDKDAKKAAARRTLLKTLAAGGGVLALPDEWKKPVVRAVIVPAHAQTKS